MLNISDEDLDTAILIRDLKRGYGVKDELQLMRRALTLAKVILRHSENGKAVLIYQGQKVNLILNEPPDDN